MADPMLVLKMIGLSGKVRVERVFESDDVLGMHAVGPVLWTPDARGHREADHRRPAAGEIELLGSEVPLPQPVVRALSGKRQALFASPERGL